MNPLTRSVSAAVDRVGRLLPIALAMTMFLILAPGVCVSAGAQTPSRAKDGASAAVDDAADDDDESGVPTRGGLGWTGIGLASAGGLLVAGSFTFNDSKSCGFFNELACRDVGRVYGTTGGIMVATGLTFLIIDEVRRHPGPDRKPSRQTAIAIGPRAIQVRMSF
jgi:hypothetical protein